MDTDPNTQPHGPLTSSLTNHIKNDLKHQYGSMRHIIIQSSHKATVIPVIQPMSFLHRSILPWNWSQEEKACSSKSAPWKQRPFFSSSMKISRFGRTKKTEHAAHTTIQLIQCWAERGGWTWQVKRSQGNDFCRQWLAFQMNQREGATPKEAKQETHGTLKVTAKQ